MSNSLSLTTLSRTLGLSLVTLTLSACPLDMFDTDDATATFTDPGGNVDTIATGLVVEGSTGFMTTTTAPPSEDDTGPAVCVLTPVYVDTSPDMQRPFMRATHPGCSRDELADAALAWTLVNMSDPNVSPGGLVPGLLAPDEFPDSVTDTCVIVMWGLDNKAPLVWNITDDDTPVVQSGLVMEYVPDQPVAWDSDLDQWMGKAPIEPPTCPPSEH